jgi:phosphatidate cytidylyltransferase
MSRETWRRVWHAIPLIAIAIVIVILGGPWFAGALLVLGSLALREYVVMTQPARPMFAAMCIGLAGLIGAAYFGTAFNVLIWVAAPFLLFLGVALLRKDRKGITNSIALSLLGLLWIGVPLVHAIFMRELPDYGTGLLVDVLIGAFLADTGAYAFGRAFGSRPLAPALSPNKTVEGLIGGVLLAVLGVWVAGLYQDWLSGAEALILGLVVGLIAPLGDLFESMIKRDLGRKDASSVLGAHGGILDRLDGAFFAIVAGYYVAVALVY